MIEINSLTKQYKDNEEYITALNNITLTLDETGMIGIVGVSGGGKTTFLNCISGLDKPTSGSITNINKSDVAFIFQDYQLLNSLSVRDNLSIFTDTTDDVIKETLKKVGLEDKIDKKINQLSGGQKQRIAIARAILLNAKYIFADEPTGNLDSKTSKEIMSILKELSNEKLILIVSHDKDLISSFADRILTIEDGQIINDTKQENITENNHVTENKECKEKEITFKKMLKIRKGATNKVSSSKIFNIFFTFLLMLCVFLGVNLFTTSESEIILNATKECFNYVDFEPVTNNSKAPGYVTIEKEEQIKKKIPQYTTCYENSVSMYNDDNSVSYDIEKIYVSDKYQNQELKDNEIVISYTLLYQVANVLGKEEKVQSLFTYEPYLFQNEQIKIGYTTVTIKQFDKELFGKYRADTSLTNPYLDDFEEYSSYICCNRNTFKTIKYNTSKDLFSLQGDYDMEIYEDIYSEKNPVLYSGSLPSEGNEILWAKDYIERYFPGESADSIVGKKLTVRHSDVISEINENYSLTIVGTSDKISTLPEYFSGLEEYSRDNLLMFRNRKISVPRNSLTSAKVKYLLNNYMTNSTFLSSEIEISRSLGMMIGSVILAVSIPLAGLLAAFQMVNAKQEIISNKRIIGIMKSMNYSDKSVRKIFILDSLIQNIISFVICIILSPVSILLVNKLIQDKGFASFDVFAFKWYVIILMTLILLLISYICIVIDVKKLSKKSNVDLVYER